MIENKLGLISYMKAITVNALASDDSKIKTCLHEFKLETSDVDLEMIEIHFPEVFKHLNPEDNSLENAKLRCRRRNLNFVFNRIPGKEEKAEDMPKYSYEKLVLTHVTVSYKENIPTFGLVMQKTIEQSDFYLSNANKILVQFSLEEVLEEKE